MSVRSTIIHVLDWVDDVILRHSWYWLCNRIAKSEWWPEPCRCWWCDRHLSMWERVKRAAAQLEIERAGRITEVSR